MNSRVDERDVFVRRSYLQAMGIPCWELRTDPPKMPDAENGIVVASSSPAMPARPAMEKDVGFVPWLLEQRMSLAYEGLDSEQVTDGTQDSSRRILLLSDYAPVAPAVSGFELDAAEDTLLKKVLASIDLPQARCLYGNLVDDPQQSSVTDWLATRNVILVIFMLHGDASDSAFVRRDIERLGHFSAQLALSFHPGDMLKSPALKSDTWASLRRLRPWLAQQVATDSAHHSA